MHFPLFVRFLRLYLFCYALLCVHSSFAIILKMKRKLVALVLYSYRCIVTINVLWLFLTVPLVGLQCVFGLNSDHTHLHFGNYSCLFFFQNQLFRKIISGIPPVCQVVWIQIRSDIQYAMSTNNYVSICTLIAVKTVRSCFTQCYVWVALI